MTREIPLTGGLAALVDDEDFEWLSRFDWTTNNLVRPYAVRSEYIDGKFVTIWMHREVADPKAGQEVDHIDRNTLHNRRVNLRPCSHAENMLNRRSWAASGYRGVYRDRRRWRSVIIIDSKQIHLGCFDDPEPPPLFEDEVISEQRGITLKQWSSGFVELSQFDPSTEQSPYGSEQVIGIWPQYIPALIQQLQAALDRAQSL